MKLPLGHSQTRHQNHSLGLSIAIHRRNMGWAYIRGKSMDKAWLSTMDPSLVIDPHSLIHLWLSIHTHSVS